MPTIDQALLAKLCHERIAARDLTSPEDEIVKIALRNFGRGRYRKMAKTFTSPDLFTPDIYIDLILTTFVRESPRIAALVRGDRAEWHQLYNMLDMRAKSILKIMSGLGDFDVGAFDFASETCKTIFEIPYPYDVPFEAWAVTILKRTIFARCKRSVDAMIRGRPESIDEERLGEEGTAIPLAEIIADPGSESPFALVEDQMVLDNAIAQLGSRDQREVIWASYREGLSDDEIAERLGKSKQAVYNLRNRAIARLRFIMDGPKEK